MCVELCLGCTETGPSNVMSFDNFDYASASACGAGVGCGIDPFWSEWTNACIGVCLSAVWVLTVNVSPSVD